MRHSIKIMAITLLLLSLLMPVLSENATHQDDGWDVPLYPIPTSGTYPRSPIHIPLFCYYSNGKLTFIFTATLGTVECEVVRVSDNEVFDATFYAVSGGSDSLYVSTDADDYEITLTLSNGTVYYGEYSIE